MGCGSFLRLTLGKDPVTEKYRRLSKTFYGNAREADKALRELIDKQAPAVEGVGATFGQLLDQWLEECERLDLSPTTLRNYRSSVQTSIRPRLGQVPLSTLSAKHLDALYGAMKDAGKSPKTIRNHHAASSAALHQGCAGDGQSRTWPSWPGHPGSLSNGYALHR